MTLKEILSRDRFAQLADARITVIRPGYAMAEMPVTPVLLNSAGIVQGGALFTLADIAFAAAVNSHGVLTVSTYSSIAFFKSTTKGVLRAEAKEIFDHRRLPYAEVRITDDEGALVALFTSAGYRKSEVPTQADALE